MAVAVSRDFLLFLYREEHPNITWADLSGIWPQPQWRTDLDLWYRSLRASSATTK